MFGGKISKRRLEFLLGNIVDQTILKYVCIKKSNKIIFESKSSNLVNMDDSSSDLHNNNLYYFSSDIKLQNLPPPHPPPSSRLFFPPYTGMPNIKFRARHNGRVATDRIIDSIKAENDFKRHPERFINFAESTQTITIGLDVSIVKKQLDDELRKTLIFYIISCIAILIWIFAWIFFIKNSRLKLKYAQMKEKSARLEELSLTASGLAHEVKNPLGIIRGLTQNILKNSNTSLIINSAEKIIDEVDITTERLSDFMNYARHRNPRISSINLKKYFNEVSEMLCFELNEKNIGLELDIDEINTLADKEFLDQIVINIIMNSINACSRGSIIKVNNIIIKPGICILEISDNGPGIEVTLLDNIFKPYVSNNPEGHGIGLAIVKKLIDTLEWEIDVDSQIGKGTKTIISGIKIAM